MKAPVADQTRLLTVQAHDLAIARIDARLANLPAAQQLAKASEAANLAGLELATAQAHAGDIRRELTVVEDEVSKVEARRRRDIERLESGGGSSRELQSLTQEVEALERRRDVLEESELEVMERLEEAQKEIAKLDAAHQGLVEKRTELQAQVEKETAELTAARELEVAARAESAEGLDEPLLALYERIRSRKAGVGAAGLVRRRCEGCSIELNAADVDSYRSAAPDDVLRCEECGRILVRGEDTGL